MNDFKRLPQWHIVIEASASPLAWSKSDQIRLKITKMTISPPPKPQSAAAALAVQLHHDLTQSLHIIISIISINYALCSSNKSGENPYHDCPVQMAALSCPVLSCPVLLKLQCAVLCCVPSRALVRNTA